MSVRFSLIYEEHWSRKWVEEQGITFATSKVLIKIIPSNGSTREKRIFVKAMVNFKKRNFV